MPLVKEPVYIKESTPLQCGQAVLAMLSGLDTETVVKEVGTERETTKKQMFAFLDKHNINYSGERKEVREKSELPNVAILSLETPKCWHWSLYINGKFLDPEHGVSDDFPKSQRRYYFEIKDDK